MDLRSVLGSLQLPVAVLGALVAVGSFWAITNIAPTPEQGGLPGGLAMLSLYVVGVGGIAVCALGFAIPPGDGVGIRFERRQRYLFGLAAVGAIGSVVIPLVTLPILLGAGPEYDLLWLLGVVWIAPLAVSGLSLLCALGWRGVTAASRYLDDGGDAGSAT
jgi:hypothetical protein